MAFPAYLLDSGNKVKLANLRAVSVNSNYPLVNAQLLPVALPYRTAEGKITGQVVDIDLPYAISMKFFAAINHNLNSDGTIKVNAGTTPSPDGSVFTTTITYREKTAWKQQNVATTAYKYWRWEFENESNAEGFLQVGYLMMGTEVQFINLGFLYGWELIPDSINRVNSSDLGVPLVGINLGNNDQYNLTFEALSGADRTTLKDWIAGLKREKNPLFFVPDPDNTDAIFGRLVSKFSLREVNPGLTKFSRIRFQEDNVGIPIAEDPPFHYES